MSRRRAPRPAGRACRRALVALAAAAAFWMLLLATSGLQAMPEVPFPRGVESVPLGPQVEVAVAPRDAPPEVVRSLPFAPPGRAVLDHDGADTRLWARVALRNDGKAPRQALLEVQNPFGRLVVLTATRGEDGAPGTFAEARIDGAAPFTARPIPYHYPLFSVEAEPGATVELYLGVEGAFGSYPAKLWGSVAFTKAAREDNLVTGATFGVLLAVVAHALFVFASIRAPSYALYALFVSAFGLLQLALFGYGFQFLWPGSPGWNVRSPAVLNAATCAFYLAFAASFLETERVSPRLHRGLWGLAALAAALGMVSLLSVRWLPASVTRLSLYGPAVGAAVTLAVALYTWRRRVTAAPFFVAAVGALVLGMALYQAQLGGSLPAVPWTTYGLQLGAVGEALVFTFGLARSYHRVTAELGIRVGELEEQRRQVSELNTELRRQVAERSQLLAEALARLDRGSEPQGAELAEGTLVADRYRLGRPCGEGAMGVVYEATRVDDGAPVAVKVLTEVRAPKARERFAREAEIAATVTHPRVVPVLDVGVARDGFLFVVMELVKGPSLEALYTKYGELPFCLEVLTQVAEGLAGIHAQGVVHRDLKPANVLVVTDARGAPSAKITDFGVATATFGRRDDDGGTRAGSLLGTPNYMAPELGRPGVPASPAADVWSFGCLAFEVLTGRRPHRSAPVLARLRGSSIPPPPDLHTLAPAVPAAVADLIMACLDELPSARPSAPTIAEVLTEVRGRSA